MSFTVVDSFAPAIIGCPSGILSSAEFDSLGVSVDWTPPIASDPSGVVMTESSHKPGHVFPIGLTVVSYEFKDQFLNKAECNFTVQVKGGKQL